MRCRCLNTTNKKQLNFDYFFYSHVLSFIKYRRMSTSIQPSAGTFGDGASTIMFLKKSIAVHCFKYSVGPDGTETYLKHREIHVRG